ncbi:MAG: hypothetical protein EBX95_13940, partial [Acidimicrobiia bacterium]|nr:hypothetical protein [Acidimicrobiia bacterium]
LLLDQDILKIHPQYIDSIHFQQQNHFHNYMLSNKNNNNSLYLPDHCHMHKYNCYNMNNNYKNMDFYLMQLSYY